MGIFEAIVVYTSAWWLIFLPTLSAGQTSQKEAGDIVAGSDGDTGIGVLRADERRACQTHGVGLVRLRDLSGFGARGHGDDQTQDPWAQTGHRENGGIISSI